MVTFYIEMSSCVLWLALYYPIVIVARNSYHTVALGLVIPIFCMTIIVRSGYSINPRIPSTFLISLGSEISICVGYAPVVWCDDISKPVCAYLLQAAIFLPLLLMYSSTFPYAATLVNFPQHTKYQVAFIIKAFVFLLATYISPMVSYDSRKVVLCYIAGDSIVAAIIFFFLSTGFSYWLERKYFGAYAVSPRYFY